ncbi:hypothetical protein ARMGADRAFT_1032525 [Armillaria gallica]|uniref:Uncharacterized protein n=1 Tax=Armillaria gallica TaxID=47427 RepID=A0A2H3D8U3_ARMGA|nr:hypothetical protein ARMGADRAFT_1032525 [Armillaria gallica]
MAPKLSTLATEPPKALIECINHLKTLLEHLPDSNELPLNPAKSKYIFYLDPEVLSEDPSGIAALSHCLEVAFETWFRPDGEIEFKDLILQKKPKASPIIISDSDSDDQSLPPRTVNHSSQGSDQHQTDSENASTASQASASISLLEPFGDWKRPVKGSQKTLGDVGWKKWGPGERDAYLKKAAANVAEQREEQRELKEREEKEVEDRQQMLGATQIMDWSRSAAVKMLQCDYPLLFSKLSKGTISKWTEHSKKEWSKKALTNIQNCTVLEGSGRVGILTGYQDVQDAINEAFQVFYNGLQERLCMQWPLLPANSPDLCEWAFFRIIYAMKWFNISPEVGVWVLPNNSYTFHEKGAWQVDVVAKDEKQCYTALTASMASRTFLPFQQVWAGKTAGHFQVVMLHE